MSDEILEIHGTQASLLVLRLKRNKKLSESDWTQTNDVVMQNQEEWVKYRQALRDLPANTEDPVNPEWPEQPKVKIVPDKTKLEKTQADLQSEKEKVATMELLVASLVKRVGDLENLVI